ncbi:LytR C-terminal domain-containing protein [Nocardioides sp.]|uniref:LytR C-terminal domain-containing protein n=1 Tax=Nocardioides sp. TaxID=35761 RepID=UPI003D0F4D7F
MAFPSPLVILSIVAVAMAGLAFVATQDSGAPDDRAQTVAQPSASPTPTATPAPAPPKKVKKPAIKRGEIFVEVYNNSGIAGLAGTTAQRASGAGWNVVGSDNWYGTIPSSTVYFPPRLAAAAKALAKDLGISRLQPAVDPMRFDRLTVILTGDAA